MKKIVLYAVLIIAAVFYIAQTSFAESSFFDMDGLVFSGKEVQENLYKGSEGEEVDPIEVKAQDKIYSRGSSLYVGEQTKKQLNLVFPMYINDGAAVRMMSGNETLITSDFAEESAYESLIINNGAAFNDDLERADWNEYILVRLSNGIYINTVKMEVKTFLHDRSIPVNSFCYFTPDFIRYYYYDNGKFKSGSIGDVDYDSVITIGGNKLTYYDFLLAIGEIDVETEKNNFITPQEPTQDEEEPKPAEHDKKDNKGQSQQTKPDDNVTEPQQPQQPEKPKPADKVDDVKPADPADPAAPAAPPAAPSVPETPVQPKPPEGGGNLEIKIPDWKMPVVTPGSTLTPGVYTLKTQVKVDDPAGVIVGGITYEICINEGKDVGKVYKRLAVAVEGSEMTDVIISGLKPDYNFTVRGFFKYKDKYGRVQSEVVTFLEPKEFKTKELSELGKIKLEDFNLKEAKFYPNKIELPNVKFRADSDIDAVGSLTQVVIRFTTEGETKKQATLLSSKNLEKLMNMKGIYFVSNSDLKANTEYEVEVACYDRFSNQLEVEGSHTVSRTCKNLPKGKLDIDFPDAKSIGFSLSITNTDNVEYKNMRLVIKDSAGNTVKFNGQDYLRIEPGTKLTIDTPGNNKTYMAYILCDCDINDGKGEREQQILSKAFTTSSISQLGALVITGENKTADVVEGVAYDRAVIGVSLNRKVTNPELPQFVSIVTLTLSNDKETFSVSLSEDELKTFKNGEEILLDTNNFTNGLSSNTTYKVNFTAKAKLNDELIDIKTSCNLKSIKTPRRPVVVEMKNVQGYTGFIEADIRISDVDDVIVGDTAILQVRKEKGLSTVLVGAFRVPKNVSEFYKVRMYQDGTLSSDGKSYTIEGGANYLLRVVAEEANTEAGLKTNYVLEEKELKTAVGVSGKVYLKALTPIESTGRYTAEMLVNIEDPSQWLGNKTCYVDVYRKTASGSRYLETKELKYEGTGTGGTPLSFEIEVDGSSIKTNKYEFNLYVKPNETITIPLSSVDFSTEEQIYTISSAQEFIDIKSYDRKYVVICDINYKNTSDDYRTGPWKQTAVNARVDFQGFALDLTGHCVFMWQLNKGGSISNMILRNHVDYTETRKVAQNGANDAGVFLHKNYGVLSNIKVEYDETEYPFKTGTYWSDTEEHFKIAQDSNNPDSKKYRYGYSPYTNALVASNYNLIENFVVEVKTSFTASYYGAVVVESNNGTLRNGYVYGSDPENNYMAEIEVYTNESGAGANTEKRTGAVVGVNNSGASVENVFALANINDMVSNQTYTSIIVGRNGGKLYNSYSVGDVLYDGKARTSYGPAHITNGGQYGNVYYVSGNSYTTAGNLYASIVALRNATWQSNILNKNSRSIQGFDVDDLININCYPQVKYTSPVMPVQDYIPLPFIETTSKVDMVFSDTYVPDPKNELNDKLEPWVEGNQAWDKPDENGKTYQTQVAVLQITDKSARDVYSVDISNLDSEVLATYKDGTGITTVYVKVSNPTACLSAYPINSITFATYAGNAGSTYSFSDRYVNVEYYWRVYNEKSSQDGWNKVFSKYKENFVLMNDLDFSQLTPKDVYVKNDYSGILDGNGYEIKNLNPVDCPYKALGNGDVDTGIFRYLKGTVKNLTLRNISFEGANKSGILAGSAYNSHIENVYAVGCYILGGANVGGLVGESGNTTIMNCGVSDTKIVNTGGRPNSSLQTGGVVGYMNGGVNLSRCYAQNVYIESMLLGHHSTSVGGLTAIVAGSNNSIIGCYATGTIHASADATGGLIGVYSSSNSNVSDTYADMDIYAYNGSSGGLVGRAAKTSPGDDPIGVSFGNITSGVLMEEGDSRRDTYSMVCMDSSYIKGVYYADAKLTLDKGGENHAAEATHGNISLSYSDYASDGIYNYIDPAYFTIEGEGTLPRLTDKDGKLLPNQQSEYIDFDKAVSSSTLIVSKNGGGSYDINMKIEHDADVSIDAIYTDFTYIDEMLGIKGEDVFNSFTDNQVFSAPRYIRSGTQTTIELTSVSPEVCYDLYHLAGIKISKNGQSTVVRVGITLDIDQQFCDVNSITDWQSKVKGSYGENFKINGDIDFSGVKKLTKYDDTANTVINRLVGNKGETEDYLKAGEDDYDSPYYTISNATLAPKTNGHYNDKIGWLYNHANGLIRGIISECSKLTFENIQVDVRSDRVGIIATATGKLSGLIFESCNVNVAKGNNTDAGMIALSGGTVEKVYSKNCNVTGNGNAGGIIGLMRARTFNSGAGDFVVEKANVISHGDRAGGAVGEIFQGSFEYTVSTGDDRTTLKNCKVFYSKITSESSQAGGVVGVPSCSIVVNCTVEDTKISANKSQAGGITGRLNNYTMLRYCSVNNVDVSSSKSNAGGIAGDLHRDGVVVLRCYVYDSKIVTDKQAGGAIGEGEVNRQIYVENCIVVAKTDSAGGISGAIDSNNLGNPGHLSSSSTSVDADNMAGWVSNTKIYSSQKAGGAVGENTQDTGLYIVTDCEVRGYQSVGGIVGRITNSKIVDQCYCSNTFISVMTDDIAGQYGITKLDTKSNFGGIAGQTNIGQIRSCMVDGCVIGTTGANYVGGLAGWYTPPAGDNATNFNVAQNSVVVGSFDVGGMVGVGKVSSYNSKATKMMKHSYNNCLVVGDNNVGGLAGEMNNGPSGTSAGKTVYSPMPYMTEIFFTGAIKSSQNASAIYGKYQVLGAETLNAEINRVMTTPKYIDSPVIEPVTKENDLYDWDQVIKSKATLYVSMWNQTELRSFSAASTMAELLGSDRYKNYVADRTTVDRRSAGGPFILTFSDSNQIRSNVHVWGLHTTSLFVYNDEMRKQNLMPFTKSSATGNPLLYNNVTVTNVMENPFTVKKLSLTMKQGVHIPGTAEYEAEIKAMEQMYEDFIGGNGANTLNALGRTDNGVAFADDSIDWSLSVKAYAVDADKINIEFEPTLYNLMKDTGRVTISAYMDSSSRILLENAPADSRTYTLEYDFKENLRLEASFEDDAGTPQSLSVDIYPSSLSSRVMLHNGEGYYITGDGLYKASDQTLIAEGDFVNLAGGKLLDSSGTVYNVNSMEQTGTAGQAQLLDESHALYEFSYDGSRIKTYGTYSIIAGPSGTNISTDKRFYEKNGRLIVIKNNINAVCDGIFAYYEGEDSYEIVLTGGGSLRSFGSVPVLDRLTGFTNSGIGAMASNMNSGGTTLLIERLDGSISGYDILTGAELFRTEAIYKVSLSQYVSDFVAGLFSMKRGGAEQSSREVDSLIAIMEQSELSLDEVLAMAEQSLGEGASDGDITAEDILAGINGGENGEPNDQPGSEPNDEPGIEPNNEPGSEPNEGTDNVEQDGENGGDAGNEGGENADNIAGNNAGTDDNAMAAGPLAPESIESIGGIQKKKQQYVSVYDAETNSFEIYDTVKLLDNPQEIVSECEKIVDKASLKAMYKALAEKEDNDSKRGMLLYTIVILSIIGIVLGIIGSRVKQKK